MEEDKAKDERYNTSLKIQFWKQPNKKKKGESRTLWRQRGEFSNCDEDN